MLSLAVPSFQGCIRTSLFFPLNRSLQSEDLHPPRGVAASGFRPLRKIPHCCLPEESGPCLSPSVADHPLRSATHRSLGEPLPHHQANGAWTPLQAPACKQRPALICEAEASRMLCGISPPFGGLSPTSGQVTHVLLTRLPLYSPPEGSFLVRLACVKHAASVRSEPGSNSPVNR